VSNSPRRAAIFLDRDGTLIKDANYPADPREVTPIPGAAEALRQFQSMGFALVVVSNQSGVGRGFITDEQAAAVDTQFRDIFSRAGIVFDGVYYCPHSPDAGCDCRKPRPGLLHRAAGELNLSLSDSVLIGDKIEDGQAAQAVGGLGILVTVDPERARAGAASGLAVFPRMADTIAAVRRVAGAPLGAGVPSP
jgi:histidinol-phosphate phosphatase family domain/HAD-superfamily hydrolase, subfamily IIIA